MERTINLTNETQVLINAILDLDRISSSVYGYVRDNFTEDSPVDPTGDDILTASNNLRDVIQGYLKDRFETAMTLTANIEGKQVTI